MPDAPKTAMINVAELTGDETPVTFIVNMGGAEKRYPMRQASMTLGRSDQMDIPCKDASVSSRHLEFHKEGGQLHVRDLGSSNGTYMNDERITEAELHHGDVVRVGATVTVTVEMGEAAPPPRRPQRRPQPQPEPEEEAPMPAPPPRRQRPQMPPPMQMHVPEPEESGKGKLFLILGIVALVVVGAVVALVLVLGGRAKAADQALVTEITKGVGKLTAATPCTVVQESVAEIIEIDKNIGVVTPQLPRFPRLVPIYNRFIDAQREKGRQYGRMVGTIEAFQLAGQPAVDSIKSDIAKIKNEELKAKADELGALLEERTIAANDFIGNWRKLQTETTRYADLVDAVFVQGATGNASAYQEWRFTKQSPQIIAACKRAYEASKKSLDEKAEELSAAAAEL